MIHFFQIITHFYKNQHGTLSVDFFVASEKGRFLKFLIFFASSLKYARLPWNLMHQHQIKGPNARICEGRWTR